MIESPFAGTVTCKPGAICPSACVTAVAISWAVVEGPFAKRELDPEFVAGEEARVTRGYLRLLEVFEQEMPITDYPLPGVMGRWQDAPAARS